jgi:hypothetical protein
MRLHEYRIVTSFDEHRPGSGATFTVHDQDGPLADAAYTHPAFAWERIEREAEDGHL